MFGIEVDVDHWRVVSGQLFLAQRLHTSTRPLSSVLCTSAKISKASWLLQRSACSGQLCDRRA